MSLTTLAAFLAAPRRPSPATRALATLHVIDTVGALVAAARTPEGEALLRFRKEAGPPSEMARNVTALCALARLSEVDDIHLASMTTPGSIVIAGALAIAAARPSCDRDAFIGAALAGYEAMVRLGLALDGPTILYRGIWPTYFAAPFGIAAAASRLLGLDASETAHALALALTYAAPGVGHHNASTTSRWLAIGHAAVNGLAAAQAALAGFTADVRLLDGGFFPGVYSMTPNPVALTEHLGTREVLAEVSFKPWCAARQTMAATQALKDLLADGVRAADIVAVRAAVLPTQRRMIDHGVIAGDRASYLTSLPYNMAVAALAPELANTLNPAKADVPAAVTDFIGRITVEPDEALLADYPQSWPAQVTVSTTSGVCTRKITAIPGDPARPFGAAEVAAKFRRFTNPVIGEAAADALLHSAENDAPAALLQQVERNLQSA
jgi:2-methylcitrate dehydratase PrpD